MEDRPVHIMKMDGVGHIVLDRPKALNSMSLEMGKIALEALEEFANDPGVRAVVLRGNGKVFSAGGDIKAMTKSINDGKAEYYFGEPLVTFHKMVQAIRDLPKPVLCAVHGAVAGFAFNLMLACDLRLAAEGTRFNQSFVRIGVSPDGGGTFFLPRIVGHARACELTMLPDEMDARKAMEWGLVNWVVPEKDYPERMLEIAGRLAKCPGPSVARTKELLNRAWDRTLEEQMGAERLAQIENSKSPNFGEGLKAFAEKRDPVFKE